MSVSPFLIEIASKLAKNPHSSANLEARIILAFILKCSINELFLKTKIHLNLIQKVKLKHLLSRRIKGVPLAHLIKKREFFNENFYINKNVLDPRADSESLVELIIANENDNLSKKVLEIGVGSGCLIITILKHKPNWLGVGVDICSKALKVAKINRKNFKLQQKLTLLKSNLFSKIKPQLFDIIISNPPYIPSCEIIKLQNEVAIYEPRKALDGGKDGLDFYRNIAKDCSVFLKKTGSIYLEIGENQHSKVAKIFDHQGFILVSQKKDLAGIIRVLHFKKNN